MGVTAQAARAPGVPTSRWRRIEWTPYLLLIPSLVFLAFFFLAPMIQALGLALQSPNGSFTLAAFDRMVNDAAFRQALIVTLVLIVAILPF